MLVGDGVTGLGAVGVVVGTVVAVRGVPVVVGGDAVHQDGLHPGSAAAVEPGEAPETQETQGTGPLADESPSQEDAASEQETQVLRPEDQNSAGSAADEPGDDGPDRVVWSTETDSAAEPVEEPAAQGPVDGEPVAAGPEPSTTGTADDTAVGEPGASEEVEREEPTLAEESSSHEFFDRESSDKGSGDSRISRASRFLRRRE